MKFIWLSFTPVLSLWQSWIMTYMTRNYLLSLKLSKFDDTIWRVWPILLTLLWITKTLSTFLLPRCWPRSKHSGLSISFSSNLSSGSILVVLVPNWMLSLDCGTFILKGRILATLQSTLATSNQSLLKNNLQSPYKLLSSSFLFFVQIQSLIWIPYTETFFQLSLVVQLLQNISLQMADGLQIQTVFSFSIIESIY